MKICKYVFASLALRRFPRWRSSPDDCLRQVEACRLKGMRSKRYLNMKPLYELKENELKQELEKEGREM